MPRRNSPLRKAARAVGRGPSDAASPRGVAMGDARLMIQAAGVDVANRRVLNVIGATSIVDNPTTGAVDLTLPTTGSGNIRVDEAGTLKSTRPEINFTGAGNASVTVVDNGVDLRADIEIAVYDTPAIEAIGATTPAADSLPYYDSVSTAATTTLTAAGRALLDDANAAAQRTTLGLDEVYSDAPMQAIAMNVVAYVDLVSKSITVAAGDTIEVEARGTLLNNSAAVRTYRVQAEIAVGANLLNCEVIDGGSIAASATNQAEWWIRATFSVKDATSAGAVVECDRGVPGAANTGQSTAGTTVRRGWQTSASSFVGAATVELRMRSDNATATQTFTLHSWKLTRRPQRL